jgi:putative flavoprotein involved in K+ transport
MRLPGHSYQGTDVDGFAPRDAVVRFIEGYADFIRAPLRCGVSVVSLRLRPGSPRFQIQTRDGRIRATNVVIATGPYQRPAIPQAFEYATRGVFQIHSSGYRNPAQLPPGAVLIVGSGNSGCQITEDLMRSGRRVYLAVGEHRRVPRRYRSRDCTWWEFALGEWNQTADQQSSKRVARLLTGVDGGHDIDLRRFALDGVTLLGRLLAGQGGKLAFAADLGAILARGDESFVDFIKSADEHARRNELELPDEDRLHDALPDPREVSDPIRELNLKAAGISSVVWACGFRYDLRWVHAPIFSDMTHSTAQAPIHRRGVTDVAGLYFIGLSWLSGRKSSLMAGVGEDAAFIAGHIASQKQSIG